MACMEARWLSPSSGARRNVLDEQTGGMMITGAAIDSREVKPGFLFFAMKGERRDGHEFVEDAAAGGAAACVVAEAWVERFAGVASPLLVVKDVQTALWRLARWVRDRFPASLRVIAVTGSNGKTTTKAMLQHVLSAAWPGRSSRGSFNNHLGVPLTLLSAEASDRFLVVEIGTNAPGEVRALAQLARPHVGIVTSIGWAHVEGLPGLEAVAREKLSLLQELEPGGSAFLPAASEEAQREWDRMNREGEWEPERIKIEFVSSNGVQNAAGALIAGSAKGSNRATIGVLEPDISSGALWTARHFASNAALVIAVVRSLGILEERAWERLSGFQPLAGRGGRHRLRCGAILLDDSYNANPSSMMMGLEVLAAMVGRRRVAVLGDMYELGSFSRRLHEQVGAAVGRSGVEWLIAVGERAARLADAAAAAGSARVTHAANGEAALALLRSELSSNDAVWVKGSRAMRLERIVEALLEADRAAA